MFYVHTCLCMLIDCHCNDCMLPAWRNKLLHNSEYVKITLNSITNWPEYHAYLCQTNEYIVLSDPPRKMKEIYPFPNWRYKPYSHWLLLQCCNLALSNTICGDEAKTSEWLLHFCTFLINPHFELEADYIIRKPMKRCFQWYIVCTSHGNTVTFSHKSNTFLLNKPVGEKQAPQNLQKPPLPLQHVDPHLIHQCLSRPLSLVTTPNDSSIGSCTAMFHCGHTYGWTDIFTGFIRSSLRRWPKNWKG